MMNALPDEVLAHIADYSVRPVELYLKSEVRGVGNDLVSLHLGLGCSNEAASTKWRRVYQLIEKYHIYQDDYEDWVVRHTTMGSPGGPPLLIDACLSGCSLSCAVRSMRSFDDAVFADIREIAALIPESVGSTFGQLRCRTRVTPLHAAIYNESVPIEVVAHLLAHGANPKDQVRIDGEPTRITEDLYGNVPTERIDAVRNLFRGYSL